MTSQVFVSVTSDVARRVFGRPGLEPLTSVAVSIFVAVDAAFVAVKVSTEPGFEPAAALGLLDKRRGDVVSGHDVEGGVVVVVDVERHLVAARELSLSSEVAAVDSVTGNQIWV